MTAIGSASKKMFAILFSCARSARKNFPMAVPVVSRGRGSGRVLVREAEPAGRNYTAGRTTGAICRKAVSQRLRRANGLTSQAHIVIVPSGYTDDHDGTSFGFR